MNDKKCCRCKKVKQTTDFHKNKYRKDGFSSACKKCRLLEANTYYENNREERLAYAKIAYQEDPEKFAKRNKKYDEEDPERKRQNNKKGHIKWYSTEENKKRKQEYYYENKDHIQEYHRDYKPKREKEDLNFKIINRLRTRMSMALKKGYKSGSAVRDLGCSIEEFISYIESFWEPGMSWDNYGKKKGQWSIDHTIPLSSFDLTNREQFLMAAHYSNMRPMWHIKNMRKHAKVLK